MLTGDTRLKRPDGLREWAEKLLLERAANLDALTTDEVYKLVRDLQARQVELEAQNEKLRRMSPEEIRRLVHGLETQIDKLQSIHQELKQSQDGGLNQKQVQRLIDSNIIGIQISSADGGIISANDAYLEIVGYTREDMLAGRINWRELTSPECLWLDDRGVREVLERGYCTPYEKEYIREDGSRAAVLLGSVVWETGANPTAVSFVLDITDRRRAEKERERLLGQVAREKEKAAEAAYILAREKDLLQVIMENVGASLAYLDRDFNFLRVNSLCTRWLGSTVDGLIGRNCLDVFPEGDRSLFEHVRDTGKEVSFHDRPFSLPGQPNLTYWDWTLTPVKDASGTVQGLVLSAVDTTRRKLVETALQGALDKLENKVVERTAGLKAMNEELQQRETSLRLFLEQTPGAVWTTDGEFRYTWASGTPFNKNYKASELVGKTVYDYFGTKDPEVTEVKAYRQALSGLPVSYEREQDGIMRHVHLKPLYDARGKISGVIGISIDITERKRVEEELRELSRRLVNAQEDERRAVARELHDQVSQSLALLKLLLDRAMSTPAGRLNFSFSEAQELVMELVTQVRDMSLNLRPKMLDDLGLLPTLVWHFDRYTSQANIRVHFRHAGLDRGFPPEMSTAAYRIIQETLSNVARHARVGEVWVRVWCSGDTLCLRVKDKGAGFDLARLKTASTGISGMRERVMLLGGRFELKTAPGAGTSITARLPITGSSST